MVEKILKYEFKEGLPQEFEIVDLKKIFEEFRTDLIAPHRTGFYHIIWFQKGSPTHLVDFNPIKIKENSILFLNKDMVHCFDKNGKFEGKAILFTDNFFCKTEADTTTLRSSILFNDLLSISQISIQKSTLIFETIYGQLETELQQMNDSNQSDIIRNNLRNLLLHAERERRKQDFIELKKDADLVYALQLKDLLDNNFITHKKVSFYCKEMHITPKRLNQVTTKIFGKTPKTIIDDRVLLEIKRLLAHTNESIKEIAYSLGFEEPTNFIKYFKKHTRKTPIEFRTQHALA